MKKLYFLLLVVFLPMHAPAQTDSIYFEDQEQSVYPGELDEEATPLVRPPVPPAQPTAMREVRNDQWKDASKGLDYSDDVPKPPKKTQKNQSNPYNPPNFSGDWLSGLSGLGNFLQILAIVLAIGLVGYGAYRLLEAPRDRTIASDGVVITVDNLDHYIHETDLERFLREALAQGNYPLAVRLYYLQAIKDLSAKSTIKWAREKTNRDYQREMRNHHLSQPFRQVTLLFERVWYGNDPLSAEQYAKIEPTFKDFLQAIR